MTAVLPSTAALAAFFRGIDRRAAVLAELQCGDPLAGNAALAAAMRAFRTSAGPLPLAQWPERFWALLLATPQLRRSAPPSAWAPQWQPLAALGNGPRAAVLLRLAAGLDIDAAAAVLAVAPATYLAALQPVATDNVWQALEAAIQQQVQSLSPQRLAHLAQLRERALLGQPAPPPRAPVAATQPRAPRRWSLALSWLGLAACVAGFAATFFWSRPPGDADAALPGRSEALPPAAAPAARFDADFAASSHRDFALLADPEGLRKAQTLSLNAWYVAELAKTPVAASAAPVMDVVPAIAAPGPVLPSASWAAMDASQRAGYLQRMASWDALPAAERGAQRERYHAWQALNAIEQAQVDTAAQAFAGLPEAEQQAVRQRFAALDASIQRGWLLGPDLGADYPKLHPLLAQLPAEQHASLLVALRVMGAAERADLARLAQRLPPQQRADLLRGLLATPVADRGAWLRLRVAD
ncbi:DUF3106 domain-containing protein [Lysobacter sp. CFH 32150]|uniref:DUF3106 domain-containing protein n=1 Tax=Lysobacter sp. CFH 32150 TaxID=2927128 RepID=UPI001FA6BB79|nr:DUF3106 domain-containing protein [Lysobacter sp. CFH 32150]MCI4568125.1 DUF3106 domain-containing protein [Lysobacter sp. CFH 32150]